MRGDWNMNTFLDSMHDTDGEDNGTMWYDDAREDMVQILCKRIGEWLLS